MKAAAHKMAQRYKITANSSVHGKGLLNTKRAVICTRKVRNRHKKISPPTVSAIRFKPRIDQRVLLMRSSKPAGQTLA